ncbi:uncharacterized protein (TIGR00369 family) [Litoreibacter halocynthiae]|uniref:Uncharacterized protein (TIGR00369 family) n=1 Tax=Litoreibacter halocynthiae TaxID=1242689 RepID=A0A4R7LL99_9RHOB|nr:PaaI family thioesterase [Litoreibacter halocynthiae]TDT75211.1 uncharacterized protein (TIGR00369 family) [Litoreibacter halocynthiae]
MPSSPRNPDYETTVKDSFARQAMMATAGASLTEVSAGQCIIAAPIRASMTQQHGFGHAALTFALGDSAAGYAALTLMEKGQEVLTSEMKINLLAPAKGDHLKAVGRVLKAGRRLVVVQSDVYAIDGEVETHIAALQGTMVPV